MNPKRIAAMGIRSKYPDLTPAQVDALAEVMLACAAAQVAGLSQEQVVLVAIHSTEPQRRTA